MTTYNVHIYREMRLSYGGIDADSAEAAAAIAHDTPTTDADSIDDCEGETLAALVDVAGDEDYGQSRFIDFEPERQRKAASALLASLKAILPYAQSEGESLYECWKRDGDLQIKDASDKCVQAIEKAHAAMGLATSAGFTSATPEIDVDALLAKRRQVAVIWSIEDVKEVRPDLTDDQCWEVLEYTRRKHDAELGICWETLDCVADELFGESPDGNQPEEAQL